MSWKQQPHLLRPKPNSKDVFLVQIDMPAKHDAAQSRTKAANAKVLNRATSRQR